MSAESEVSSSDNQKTPVRSKSENLSEEPVSEISDDPSDHKAAVSEGQLEQSDAEEEGYRRATDSFSDHMSNDEQAEENLSDFSISENPKLKSESKRLLMILQDIKKGLARLECEADEPVTAMFAIEHLFVSGFATTELIFSCFEEVHREFAHLLKNIRISSIIFLMYEQIENLEISVIGKGDDWPGKALVHDVVDALRGVPVEVSGLRAMRVVIEKARLLKEFLEKETGCEEMLSAIEAFLENAAPLGMILAVLSGINTFIREMKSDRFEIMRIQFPPYANPVLAGYEPVKFQENRPNDYVKDRIMNLVDEIESYGVDLRIDKSEALRMKVVNLEIPNFSDLLTELSECMKTIAGIPGHGDLEAFVIDLLQKPLIFYHLFLLEKRLVALERSMYDGEASPCVKKATHNLLVLRKIHHLFRLLDGEMLVPYSTSVHLAYFRTFAHQLSGVDHLKNQAIILPLNVCTLIEISNSTITKINPAMIFQRIEFQKWIRLTMIDVFSEALKAKTEEEFNRASDWLVFLINVRAEYDVPEVIADEMKRLPPYPELSSSVSSYITERSFEVEASSQIIHLELILQADLKDSSLDLKAANKRQFRQLAYMKQYRDILALTVSDGTVRVSKELDIEHEEDCFTNHSSDVQIVGLVPVLIELSHHMPKLTRETLGLHEAFYSLYAGSYCRDSVIALVRQSLVNRARIENPDAFINAAAKLIRFSIFARVHDTLIATTSGAYNPPFSITRCMNVILLLRSISTRMLALNSSGFFDPSLSREIGARAFQLLDLSNMFDPFYPLPRDYRHRMKTYLDAIMPIITNFDSFTGLNMAKRAVKYLLSLGLQYSEIEHKFETLISRAKEPSMNSLASEYFDLTESIQTLSSSSEDVQGCYTIITDTSEKVMLAMTIKHSIKLALSDETPKVCVFPFSADQFFTRDMIVNEIHPDMVPQYDFPIPDRVLSLDHQIRLVKLLIELQTENEGLASQLEELTRCRKQHQILQNVLDDLHEERLQLLADNEQIKEETRKSREKLANSEDQERDQEELMKLKLSHIHDAAIDERRFAEKERVWNALFESMRGTVARSAARHRTVSEERIRLMDEHEKLVLARIEREYRKAVAEAAEARVVEAGADDRADVNFLKGWNVMLQSTYEEIRQMQKMREKMREEAMEAKRKLEERQRNNGKQFDEKIAGIRALVEEALGDCI